MALTAFGVPATVHILLAALVGIAPIYIAIQAIPDGTGKNAADGTQHGEKGVPFYRDIQLLLIGVVVLAMAFAEGSANDWLPLLMVDGHGFSPTSGSLIYAGFTLGMTVGRFTGGWFIDRYSRVAVVRASALMGALGIGLIIFVDSAWVAGVSVVLWGLGASLGFPLTISAASDTGPDAPTRVSVVATTGYLAFSSGRRCWAISANIMDYVVQCWLYWRWLFSRLLSRKPSPNPIPKRRRRWRIVDEH